MSSEELVLQKDFCAPPEKDPKSLYTAKNTSVITCEKHLLETCGEDDSSGNKKR
jgi:hypothetical protein